MCGDYQFEIDDGLECEICKNKPAVDLTDPYTGEVDLGYSFLCEKCGIDIFGEAIVSDWAGTELYLKKYPDEVANWR